MIIKSLKVENITVLGSSNISFTPGVNIIIGENGTGKTHILKIIYSACRATQAKTSFSYKLTRTMFPDDYKLSQLITKGARNKTSKIEITASNQLKNEKKLSLSFERNTKKWEGKVTGESAWEKEFAGINSIYIPAKDILANAYNLVAATERDNVRFDDTYLDLINILKIDSSDNDSDKISDDILQKLEKFTDGRMVYDNVRDEFYIKKGNSKREFNLVAEGERKLSLLWQLLKRGAIKKGDILLWDEPESNINPRIIPYIADILLELQRKGIQIFVSTHNYILAKYFEIRATEKDEVCFYSLNKNKNGIEIEKNRSFSGLKNNTLISTFEKLLDEVYELE